MHEPENHAPVRVKGEDVDYKIYYHKSWLRLEGKVLTVVLIIWLLGYLGLGS